MTAAVAAIPWHVYVVMVVFSITIGLLVALELGWPSSYERRELTRRLTHAVERRANSTERRNVVAQ